MNICHVYEHEFYTLGQLKTKSILLKIGLMLHIDTSKQIYIIHLGVVRAITLFSN